MESKKSKHKKGRMSPKGGSRSRRKKDEQIGMSANNKRAWPAE